MSQQLKQSLKLPEASKIRGKEPANAPPSSSPPITNINAKELENLLAKGTSFVDLSSNAYNLESDEFLLHCPNVIKELDLSFNSLIQLSSLKVRLSFTLHTKSQSSLLMHSHFLIVSQYPHHILYSLYIHSIPYIS